MTSFSYIFWLINLENKLSHLSFLSFCDILCEFVCLKLTLWKILILFSFPQFKIRKEAMSGLAMIYKKHLNDSDVPQATKKAVTWIKDKILHGYYMTGMEDRYSSFFIILTIMFYMFS